MISCARGGRVGTMDLPNGQSSATTITTTVSEVRTRAFARLRLDLSGPGLPSGSQRDKANVFLCD